MRDRISELESVVSRLEANVEGLREQLVEANDRIRALEAELDTEAADPPSADRSGTIGEATDERVSAGEDADTEETSEDIIVA